MEFLIIERNELKFIGTILGNGGQGKVLKAEYLKMKVAVKCFEKNRNAFFGFRKTDLLPKVRNPYINSIIAVAESFTEYNIVMEHFPSTTFFSVIFNDFTRESCNLDVVQKIDLCWQLCEALY